MTQFLFYIIKSVRFILTIIIGLILPAQLCVAQQQALERDSIMLHKIYDFELVRGKVFSRLSTLCTQIGPRLSGSKNAASAVIWSEKIMKSMGLDTVYLQKVIVPHWERGKAEKASFNSLKKNYNLAICALGGSVPTLDGGIKSQIIEVKSLQEIKLLGEGKVKGKIIFFNRAFDPSLFDTGEAYGAAVDQRVMGAIEASKYGAIGVMVRSMTEIIDDYPHTGMMRYLNGVKAIPACAVSSLGAEKLSAALKKDPLLMLSFTLNCQKLPDVASYNVISEIKGTDVSSGVILIGGHLDSWDLAQGAQDDGAGVMQALEVLEILKSCHYKPRHTIRTVFFMSEENGSSGGIEYSRIAKQSGEKHIVAIESDEGGFTPRGFTIGSTSEVYKKMLPWEKLFQNYGSGWFKLGGDGGADIEPLKDDSKALIGLMPDNQRYFDFHHTAKDRIENVNERELKLGAASMASLVYLIDKNGI